MTEDPLSTDPETMRRLGYQTVDWLVERATRRDREPVLVEESPRSMAARVPAAVPTAGETLDALLPLLADVLHHRSRIDHPRYLA